MVTEWMQRGLCREIPPAVFFPSDGVGVESARRVCANCPVKDECLGWAMSRPEVHGTWGGMSARGRQRLRRQLREAS